MKKYRRFFITLGTLSSCDQSDKKSLLGTCTHDFKLIECLSSASDQKKNSLNTNFKERIIEENRNIIKQIEERINSIEGTYEEITRNINDSWEAKKLNLISGDLLLDETCKEYGVRFKKETDGSRLAALIKEKEIDKEIIEIIKEIGSMPNAEEKL